MAKIFIGTVVSTAMKDTIVVEIERSVPHPLYRKLMKRSKKHKVHISEGQTVTIGQVVKIVETKPISKDKHFKLFTEGTEETKATKKSKESEATEESKKERSVTEKAPAEKPARARAVKKAKKEEKSS